MLLDNIIHTSRSTYVALETVKNMLSIHANRIAPFLTGRLVTDVLRAYIDLEEKLQLNQKLHGPIKGGIDVSISAAYEIEDVYRLLVNHPHLKLVLPDDYIGLVRPASLAVASAGKHEEFLQLLLAAPGTSKNRRRNTVSRWLRLSHERSMMTATSEAMLDVRIRFKDRNIHPAVLPLLREFAFGHEIRQLLKLFDPLAEEVENSIWDFVGGDDDATVFAKYCRASGAPENSTGEPLEQSASAVL